MAINKNSIESRSLKINFDDGTFKEIVLSKTTKINCDAGMFHLDKLKNETWRLIFSEDFVDDFSKINNIEIIRQ